MTVKDLLRTDFAKNKKNVSGATLYPVYFKNSNYYFYVANQGEVTPSCGKYFSRIVNGYTVVVENNRLEDNV